MMSEQRLFPERTVRDIFLPSDFSEDSEIAFVHALKLAMVAKARLSILHVSTQGDDDWGDFPGVRETLERWKLIPPNSPKHAIADLGFDVRKIVATNKDPVRACIQFLEVHNADLIVLAIHQREGIMRWLGKSIGEPIARNAKQMTLFLPHGVRGFVNRVDGSVSLKNILIPAASHPDPKPAVEAALRLIENLSLPPGKVTVLRVGQSSVGAQLSLPQESTWSWNEVVLDGEPAHVILQTAEQTEADLILMTTDGPDGFLDGLRGSTSERVLRKAKCPVGNLPVDSMLG
jgi:nucleotide-binding universal stress UspA family protein